MDQKRQPSHLWQQEHDRQPEVAKWLSWSVMLLICVGVWVSISYALWRAFLS